MTTPARELEHRALSVLSSLSYRAGELRPYLDEVAQGVSTLLGLDWTVVTLCQGDAERVLASTIDLGDAANQIYSLHGTLTGTVVNTGEPLVVEDTLSSVYADNADGYRAYLGVPLRTPAGHVIGTICSFQLQTRQFSPEDVQLVRLFAERAAIAIDNYQLYQQQQQFNEALEAEVIKRTVELRATQAKLMELNRDLEQRVAERTADLQRLNGQLQAEIVERIQAEAALRLSEERLRQLAENLTPVFWMLSLDEEPIYVSPAFEPIWGYPCDRWYANPDLWWEAIHPDDRDRVRSAFAQSKDGKFEEEYRIVRPDGSVRIILDQAFPVRDSDGQIYRIAGIAEDVTERRQSEQEMLKAIAALAEVGELAAMIVHEIRNPLTTVWMGLNYFNRLDLSEAAKERLSLSLDEAERLRNLLNEILLYTKSQALQHTTLELNQLMAEWLKSVRTMPSAMRRYIRFIPASDPIKVLGDRDKLKQIFINLIDNACQAIDEGETVTWSVEPQGQQVHIRVHNGGDPIPPDVIPKLTKPFYTTKATGTGLGLAIVKRIVEAHGGELHIASSAAAGTTVTVRLPIVLIASDTQSV